MESSEKLHWKFWVSGQIHAISGGGEPGHVIWNGGARKEAATLSL